MFFDLLEVVQEPSFHVLSNFFARLASRKRCGLKQVCDISIVDTLLNQKMTQDRGKILMARKLQQVLDLQYLCTMRKDVPLNLQSSVNCWHVKLIVRHNVKKQA